MTKRLQILTALIWINLFVVGCVPQTPLAVANSPTMQEIFHGTDQKTVDMRVSMPHSSPWSDTPQFKLLANPRLHMYVYPHLATESKVPIPGYWTVIPLYERIEYALPGEPTETRTSN